MDILIIGNGFDLAHGLKTSYSDFLDYCEHNLLEVPFGCYNVWLNYFLNKQRIGGTWIDFENKIYELLYLLFGKYHVLPHSKTISSELQINFNPDGSITVKKDSIDYKTLSNKEEFIGFLYQQLREFTKYFEKYLKDEVCTVIKKTKKFKLLGQNNQNDFYLLSFNYTDTYEQLYGHRSAYADTHLKYIYLHGKVCSGENCNLVLGTHSFDRKENDKSLPIDLNVFQKHNQRHRYNTIEPYQEFITLLTNPKKLIRPVFHIVGHSLDKTDHKILKHILLAKSNAVIKIYYHNEEAQEKLINNITDIIGEDEVMTKVQLIDQHDPDRGILKILE